MTFLIIQLAGFYFSNPSSAYFGIGKVYEDQVKDYAKRKGVNKRIVEKWLSIPWLFN